MSISGLIAGMGISKRVFDEEDERKDTREYTKQKRKLDLERGVADNALLDSRNRAGISGNELAATRNVAEQGLVAPQTELRKDVLTTEGAKAKAAAAKKDVIGKAIGDQIDADANLAQLALGQSQDDLRALPEKLRMAAQQRTIDANKMQVISMAGLRTALASGNPQAVIDYVNASLDAGFLGELKGAKANSFKRGRATVPMQTAEGTTVNEEVPALTFVTDRGEFSIPQDTIDGAYEMLNPSETEKLGLNDRLVSRDAFGNVTEVIPAQGEWKFDSDTGAYYNSATGQKVSGAGSKNHGLKPEQIRLLTNDGVNQLMLAFGAKLDPVSKLIDGESINDKDGYYRAIAELEKRVREDGENPMAAASEIAQRYRKDATVAKTRGKKGAEKAGSSAVESARKKFWE